MADVVVVAIPTFRRPRGLERVLAALAALSTDAEVHVLVADNDTERRHGIAVVERICARYRWPIEAIDVPARGISHVRNALIARALVNGTASHIAMVDDDDWPESGWLNALLAIADDTGADVVHGAVLPEFEREPGVWARSCVGLSPLRGRTGLVSMIHGTSNVLMRRTALEKLAPPWFDPAFALSGGEDKDFFTRLRRAGIRFAWADTAIVHAHVPLSRCNRAWALKRAYRIGNSDMRVLMKHERGLVARLSEGAKIGAALMLAPVMAVLFVPLPRLLMLSACKLARALGKLAALCGIRYDEYAVVHGQ
jgi:succinoglycan biosynthesis protein ExoM